MSRHDPTSNVSNRTAEPRKVYRSEEGLPITVDLGELTANRSLPYRFFIDSNETFHLGHGLNEKVFREGDPYFHASPGGGKARHKVVIKVSAGEPGLFSDSLWLYRQGRAEHEIKFTGQVLGPVEISSGPEPSEPFPWWRRVRMVTSIILLIVLGGWFAPSNLWRKSDTKPPTNAGSATPPVAKSANTESHKRESGAILVGPSSSGPNTAEGGTSDERKRNSDATVTKKSDTPSGRPSPGKSETGGTLTDFQSGVSVPGSGSHPIVVKNESNGSGLPDIGKKWSQGNVVVVLVLTHMTETHKTRIFNDIRAIREEQKALLVGGDVFIIGRKSVCPSREWLDQYMAQEAFDTNPKGFVESFSKVAAELEQIDLRRPGNPARRVVLWQSAFCPTLPSPGVPKIHDAQVIWLGGGLKDDCEALDSVFGGSEVTNRGSSIEGLYGTVESALKGYKAVARPVSTNPPVEGAP